MVQNKKAFTLIEIIFTISIVGILAFVAIPRLATTRDDAKIANALADIGALVNELGTYYTAKDEFASNLSEMSNIKDINFSIPWNSILESGIITYYTVNNRNLQEPCINFFIQNQDGNLTIQGVVNSTGNVCLGLQSTDGYKKIVGTRYFGGKNVHY
jgi:prepilin-type N-terminal cleavage/methylation domain-containing protein